MQAEKGSSGYGRQVNFKRLKTIIETPLGRSDITANVGEQTIQKECEFCKQQKLLYEKATFVAINF